MSRLGVLPSSIAFAPRRSWPRTRRLFHTWVAVGCAPGPAFTPPCLPLLQRWPWKVTRTWLGGSQDHRSPRTRREKGTNTFCDPLSRVRGTNRALANLTPAHREGGGGGKKGGASQGPLLPSHPWRNFRRSGQRGHRMRTAAAQLQSLSRELLHLLQSLPERRRKSPLLLPACDAEGSGSRARLGRNRGPGNPRRRRLRQLLCGEG